MMRPSATRAIAISAGLAWNARANGFDGGDEEADIAGLIA
jgi:hypothetical protein